MLRVIVESATNIPKTKFGKPDPIVSVIFKGKQNCHKCSQGRSFVKDSALYKYLKIWEIMFSRNYI